MLIYPVTLTKASIKRNQIMSNESMSKKFSLTVPDEIYEDLEKWAKAEGRNPANLGAFLLEIAVKRKYREKYLEAEDAR